MLLSRAVRRKTLFLLIVVLFLIPACKRSKAPIKRVFADQEKHTVKRKKKVLICTSGGGGAHVSAAGSIRQYLKNDYEVADIYVIRDLLAELDPIRTITFQAYGGEDLYNYFLSNGSTWLANKMYGFGKDNVVKKSKDMEHILTEFLRVNHPDIIISVMPFVNGALYHSAQKLHIPFLVIPVDLDNTTYVYHYPEKMTYKKFYHAILFESPEIRKVMQGAHIPESHIVVSGPPMRPDFTESKNVPALKKAMEIPEDKKVVMLLMGAAGSSKTYNYVKTLAKNTHPMHIIVCLGRNEQLRDSIKKITLPAHITTTLVGFTERISDYMAVSDVLITKTGGGSICEGICMKIPMLLDGTSETLYVERMNLSFVVDHQFGNVVTDLSQLNKLLDQYLTDQVFYDATKARLEFFKKENFESQLNELLKKLLAKPGKVA